MFSEAQQAEIDKYSRAYAKPNYRMGAQRMAHAHELLKACACRESFLDVGCGRGEMLEYARLIGFKRVMGIETIPELLGPDIQLRPAWSLGFDEDEFQVVTAWDVLEHILPDDAAATIIEFGRVASEFIFVTTNNNPSKNHIGEELHVNRMPYEAWDHLFKRCLPAWRVEWLQPAHGNPSQTWRMMRES